MPYLRLAVALFAVSASAIFARYALHGAGPLAVSALRLALASIPLVALALFRSPVRLPRATEVAFAGAGLLLAVHFVTWIGSLLYTSVAISTLLVCTTPLWTTLYDALVERKPAPGLTWIALALAAAGLVLVVANRSAPAPVPGRAVLGDALALCGAFAIGAYFTLVRRFGTHPASGIAVSTTQIVARTFSWAAAVLLLATVLVHAPWPGNDPISWGGIVAMALVSQLLGHTMLNASLRTFTPSTVAISILLEPVLAALLAALIFYERLGVTTLLGGGCVLGALWLVLRATPVIEAVL